MESFSVGTMKVYRVEELRGPLPPDYLFVGYEQEAWLAREEEFTPKYFRDGACNAFVQSWIIDTGEKVILFDTGVGNQKARPAVDFFDQLDTGFLSEMERIGFPRERIDIVVNSHLHVDHVGWNTLREDGEWRPTFPNAKYIFSELDRDHWDPANWGRTEPRGTGINQNVFEDSVQPILDADLAEIVGAGYQVAPGLTLSYAPGHTPGQMVMTAQSGDAAALFVGDTLHHPMQIYRPDWSSAFCEDPVLSAKTRSEILGLASDMNARLVPAHFGGKHWVWVERDNRGFKFSD